MLLMLAPEVWTEKLRSAAAAVTKQDDLLSPTKSGGISRINDRGTSPGRNVSGPHGRGEHWLSKVKTKAEGALNRVKKEGEKQVSNLMTRARSVSPGRKRGNRGGTEEVGNVDRLEEMQNEAKQQAAKEKAIKKEAIAKKKAERELPAKPIKPELDGDTRILLRQIMSGDVGMVSVILNVQCVQVVMFSSLLEYFECRCICMKKT